MTSVGSDCSGQANVMCSKCWKILKHYCGCPLSEKRFCKCDEPQVFEGRSN